MSSDINTLFRLVIYLLLGGLVVATVYWIVGMLNLPPAVKNIILAIMAIFVLIWLLVTFVPGLSLGVAPQLLA